METQCCTCSIHGMYWYCVYSYQVFLHPCSFNYFILSHFLILTILSCSKKTSSKKQPDFMNQSWEKILIGKIIHEYFWSCWLLIKHNDSHFQIFLFHCIMKSILNVSAIVLANLCVSYIMTSQNEEAEELMRKIEKVISFQNDFCNIIVWVIVNSALVIQIETIF